MQLNLNASNEAVRLVRQWAKELNTREGVVIERLVVAEHVRRQERALREAKQEVGHVTEAGE